MRRFSKIIYWIATLWLALGMLSTGLVQLLGLPGETDFMARLGYPAYLPALLGGWKILGGVAVLLPRFPLLKEWAYAGFFFAMSGAFFSHVAVKSPVSEVFPSLLLLALTLVSWYCRPLERKLPSANSSVL